MKKVLIASMLLAALILGGCGSTSGTTDMPDYKSSPEAYK